MNQKQFKKKFPTASFDMMADEAIASAELAGANSNWEIRFEELKKHFFVEDVKQFISDEIAKSKQEERDKWMSTIGEARINSERTDDLISPAIFINLI